MEWIQKFERRRVEVQTWLGWERVCGAVALFTRVWQDREVSCWLGILV